MIQYAQRCLAILLALCLLLPGGLIRAAAAETGEVSELREINQVILNFNEVPATADFHTNAQGLGAHYNVARFRGVADDKAIEARSVCFNQADLRWWSMNYTGKVMGFSLDVLCDENFGETILHFSPQTHISSTTTESGDGGRIITVKADETGAPGVYNYEGERVATIPLNESCRITAEAEYGKAGYSISVNGEVVSAENRYAENSAVYAVYGLRLSVNSEDDGYIVVDNLRAYLLGRPYPQSHSYQAPGEIPTLYVPKADLVEGVKVYGNETEVPVRALATADTQLLPLAETMQALGATATVQADGSATIATEAATFFLTADGKSLCWNDDTVVLATPSVMADGVLYVSGQVFAETLDAKVWYAEALELVVVSTGTYKDDDLLRSLDATFWMNGEPYYEFSFNKWDLAHQIASDLTYNETYPNNSWCTPETTLQGAEEALRELSEHGFKTIRFFCNVINPGKSEAEIEKFWSYTDQVYDLCDRYGIRAVPCLNLLGDEYLDGMYIDGGLWVSGTETYYDMIVDPTSQSRAHVYEFIDMYISRYKDRDTILMWEISNEGNGHADVGTPTSPKFSLMQLGQYYTDVTALIKENDPRHLVTSGDCYTRAAQWHLFEGTMNGTGIDWTLDTDKDRLKALWMLNKGLDVISTHTYDFGYENPSAISYIEVKGTRNYTRLVTFDLLLQEARQLGRALYNGETGGMIGPNGQALNTVNTPNTSAEAGEARARYFQLIIDAGVQLTHYWSFRSDRVDFGMDMDTWSVTLEDTPATFQAVKDANAALKARYLVNPMSDLNTHALSGKTGDGTLTRVAETTTPEVTEAPTDALTTDTPDEGGCASVLGGGLASVVMLGGLWLAALRKKKA